jgi:hypothetical protein
MKAARGTIYFTLDGSDPRLVGGKVSPAARIYREPVSLASRALAKARVMLSNQDWSPLAEEEFRR